MPLLRSLGVLFLSFSFAIACSQGGGSHKDARSAGDADDDEVMGYDEDGKGFVCETPESQCENVKELSLDFKERCRSAGYKVRQCGCNDACTGNINGERTGYTNKNVAKKCPKAESNCELQETSAAFQDACTDAGEQLIECGCEWLCSGKLKEPVPDAPKDDEAQGDEASGEASKDEKGKAKDDKPKGKMSMDGPIEDKPKK